MPERPFRALRYESYQSQLLVSRQQVTKALRRCSRWRVGHWGLVAINYHCFDCSEAFCNLTVLRSQIIPPMYSVQSYTPVVSRYQVYPVRYHHHGMDCKNTDTHTKTYIHTRILDSPATSMRQAQLPFYLHTCIHTYNNDKPYIQMTEIRQVGNLSCSISNFSPSPFMATCI